MKCHASFLFQVAMLWLLLGNLTFWRKPLQRWENGWKTINEQTDWNSCRETFGNSIVWVQKSSINRVWVKKSSINKVEVKVSVYRVEVHTWRKRDPGILDTSKFIILAVISLVYILNFVLSKFLSKNYEYK